MQPNIALQLAGRLAALASGVSQLYCHARGASASNTPARN